jgi:hypothetical protein
VRGRGAEYFGEWGSASPETRNNGRNRHRKCREKIRMKRVEEMMKK